MELKAFKQFLASLDINSDEITFRERKGNGDSLRLIFFKKVSLTPTPEF
jgi:hypothetical protein